MTAVTDPTVVGMFKAAKARCLVTLANGEKGRLIYWSRSTGKAKIRTATGHWWIQQSDIVEIGAPAPEAAT